MSRNIRAYEINSNNQKEFSVSRHNIGWTTGGSTQFTTGGRAKIIPVGEKSFILNDKEYGFKTSKTGGMPAETFFLVIFAVIALFFNIMLRVIPDVPFIALVVVGIAFIGILVPIVYSLRTIPRRASFRLDSINFVSVCFETKEAREEFFICLEAFKKEEALNGSSGIYGEASADEYEVDVVLNEFDENVKRRSLVGKVAVQNDRIRLRTDSGEQIFVDFERKSHDLMWELYPFASVFVVMPIFALFEISKYEGFNPAALFVLVFALAGIGIMFLPSILSKGKLLLLNRDGYTLITFVDPKDRAKFERDLKREDNYRAKERYPTRRARERFKGYKIFNSKNYRTPVGLIVATIIYVGVVVGVCFTKNLSAVLLAAYIGFVFYSFFTMFFKEIMRQNIVVFLRKRALNDSDLIMGEVTNIKVRDFKKGHKFFFNVAITVKFLKSDGTEQIKVFEKEMLFGYYDYKIGERVPLAVRGGMVSLLTLDNEPKIYEPKDGGAVVLEGDILKAIEPTRYRAIDALKGYSMYGEWDSSIFFYALCLLPLFIMLLSFGTAFASSSSTIEFALYGGITLVTLSVGIVVFTKLINNALKYSRLKSAIYFGVLTKAYVMNLHRVLITPNNSAERARNTYYLKLAYIDENGKPTFCYETLKLTPIRQRSVFGGHSVNFVEGDLIDVCARQGHVALMKGFREK